MYSIPELSDDCFDWQTWRRGLDVWDVLGARARHTDIIDHAEVIRKHAIGYIPGEKIWYRYKPGHMAVMFMFPDFFGWTHFRMDEFKQVFYVR